MSSSNEDFKFCFSHTAYSGVVKVFLYDLLSYLEKITDHTYILALNHIYHFCHDRLFRLYTHTPPSFDSRKLRLKVEKKLKLGL